MTKLALPRVALIGRTNVGKSTLFNRISKRTQSIVSDEEGVTRDFLTEPIEWNGKRFELIDTGGLSPMGNDDPFYDDIEAVGTKACQEASVLLFVCDAKNGITMDDKNLARKLHELKKPILLLLNKSDNKNAMRENEADFYSLGFKGHYPVSATHGNGITPVLDQIASLLPAAGPMPKAPDCRIALLGKPNVGKSSLMNALVEYDRSIVSEKAGTTREALSERISFYGQDLLLTDTAGVRRKRKVNEDLETMMVKSSFGAVRTADIVVLLIDASQEGRMTDQELKLMFYAFEEHKALLLVFNKRDLMTPEQENLLEHELGPYEYFLKKIPQLRISCLTGKNVGLVMREIEKIRGRLTQKLDGPELTEMLHEYLRHRPLFHNRQKLQIFSIQQRQEHGIAFTLCVNQPSWFGQSQLACIDRVIRKKYDLRGCPINFVVVRRGKGGPKKPAALASS